MLADTEQYLDAISAAVDAAGGEALALWRDVVRLNPCNGTYWTHLGTLSESQGSYESATDSYERAIDLGVTYPGEWAFKAARCLSRLGRADEAVDAVRRALELGYRVTDSLLTEPALAALRDRTDFLELVGRAGPDRVEGWAGDLRFLAREVRRKSHHVIRRVGLEQFEADLDELAGRVRTLRDDEIDAELMRLIASLGDGHSHYQPPAGRGFEPGLPFVVFLFDEGPYIVAAQRAHADLLGARLLAIDGHSVEALSAAVRPYVGYDNSYTVRSRLPEYLRAPSFLHTVGLTSFPDSAEVTVEAAGQATWTGAIAADESDPGDVDERHSPLAEDWISFARRTLGSPEPLHRRNRGAWHWFERLPEHRAVYFQFNVVRDSEAHSLAELTDKLAAELDRADVERLVIDVRWNGGGDTFLALPLLRLLWGSDKLRAPGGLVVLIGRRTFSACQNFVTLLERFACPVFVGEPTGSSPNFIGETVTCELPYSHAHVTISDLTWQGSWPQDYRTWLPPHIFIPPRFTDHAEDKDPALDVALSVPAERLRGWTRLAPACDSFPRDWP
jgi:tetratricopeptide (TPR) repeat protein